MDTSKFLEAVRNRDTKKLMGAERKLADSLLVSLNQTSEDFHADMIHLLEGVTDESDFTDLVTVFNTLQPKQRIQLIAMITTGDATEEFSQILDTNPQLQRAVDIAFAGHIGQLHDLGSSLKNAQEFIDRQKDGDVDTNA